VRRRRDDARIDATDARIIELLQTDGRMPNTAVAKKVGLSETAVRKRVDRLLREEIITFRAHADPLKIGFQLWAIIEVQTVPRLTQQVAQKIAALPGIFLVGLGTGHFDVYSVGVFRSTKEYNEFLTRRLQKIHGVTRTATSFITEIVKRDFAFGVPVQ
jgi:Lrp/AsnC family transcriptional regulator, regulator for asnA, asnC and gidA